MTERLYPHQQKAVDALRPGSILMGGVGTGKSRTALAFWERYKKDLYIITTPKKRDSHDWEREGRLFGLAAYDKPYKFVVDSWNNISKYTNIMGAFFIFDEQRAVGKGVWSRSFIRIAKKNLWVMLTATPGDTWMDYVPVMIANGYFRNRSDFCRKHVVFKRGVTYPIVDHYIYEDALEEIRKEIIVPMEFIGRPEPIKREITVPVQYAVRTYDRAAKDRWNMEESRPIANMSEKFALCRKLAIAHPSRLAAAERIARERKKVIIFYNFDYELAALRSKNTLLNFKIREWNGHEHDPVPTGEKWAYLVQYSAGAEAWECTTCDTIIFYSLSYSYKQMVQAAGRIDRLNTPFSKLYYYFLVSDAPIEKAVVESLRRKEDFNLSAFTSANL